MTKKGKKRKKKIYDVKALQEKWKLERFDEKKHNAKMSTITAIIGAIFLASLAIFLCFVVGIYEPIDKEETIIRTVEFDHYSSYSSKGRTRRYIELTNEERIWISVGEENLANSLRALSPGTILTLRLHPNGTILEISTETKELLNFDDAQDELRTESIFWFVVGIIMFLGMIPCIAYAWIKIVKHKVFSPSKSIYGR